jgi:DNA-binding MarR family transcriptional regulator
MSSHQRARLITHGVAFAVPGRQLYIPQLAVDLREQFGARHLSQDGHIAPVSQAVLFHYILRRNPDLITPSTLADALHYSPMSIGRAFDELASLGLARITRAGREKQLSIDRTSQELIEAVRPHLRSPVHKKYYLREMPMTSDLKLAGETALAELSTLAPPAIKVFATGNDDYRTALKGRRAEQVAHEDEADAVIEIWRYDPATLSDSSVVDVLSLYAQFWNHSHERVASAAADLLERLNW